MPYKIEFGPAEDRKVKLRLKTHEIIGAFERLSAAGERDIRIFGHSGEEVAFHTLKLAIGGNRPLS